MQNKNCPARFFSISVITLLAVTLLTLDACKKPGIVDPPGNNNNGDVTAIGEPTGPAEHKTIGPAGGIFTTPDGSVSIEIPAGAVAAATNFFITPITGHCPLSPGYAWSIAPHNVTLSKPAKVSFTYSDNDTIGTIRSLMAVAYQDSNKMWRSAKIVAHDTAARKITIETNHFSDWSLYSAFHLTSRKYNLNPGGSTDLFVYAKKNIRASTLEGEYYIPHPDDFISEESISQNIDNWKLAGEGTLIPNVTNATYVAPSTIPNINPVAISVNLKNVSAKFKLVILVANIVIGAENGILVRVDGGPWHFSTIPSQGVLETNGLMVLQGHINSPVLGGLTLSWDPRLGGPNRKLNWGVPNPSMHLTLPNEAYFQYAHTSPNLTPSPGYLKFEKYEPRTGGVFTGSFYLEKSGRLQNCVCLPTVHRVEGRFRMMWR